jgi:hypothetical protein
MRLYVILLSSILIISSCCKRDSRDDFSFERIGYQGDDLKLEGYYLKRNLERENQFLVFFLFRNGVFFGGSYHNAETIEDLDSVIIKNFNQATDVPFRWGIFQIEGVSIMIEKWVSSSDCESYPVNTYTGEILNDTTIIFDNELYDTMRFRLFSPKPDSSTRFIEGS